MNYLDIIKKIEQEPRLETPPDWLNAWRELARLTDGLLPDDPRLQSILMALRRCDDTFLANDWPAFQRAAEHVRQAVQRTR